MCAVHVKKRISRKTGKSSVHPCVLYAFPDLSVGQVISFFLQKTQRLYGNRRIFSLITACHRQPERSKVLMPAAKSSAFYPAFGHLRYPIVCGALLHCPRS